MKKILECSSKGDKRFSALVATVSVFGVSDTIENHYQCAKRTKDPSFVPRNWLDTKGKKPEYFEIGGHKYPITSGKSFYEILWVKYLDNNPELVEYAKKFDDFSDMFKSKNAVVCQADVIRDYVKLGREVIMERNKDFLNLMRTRNNMSKCS